MKLEEVIDGLLQTIFRIENVLDAIVTKESIELEGYEDRVVAVKFCRMCELSSPVGKQ